MSEKNDDLENAVKDLQDAESEKSVETDPVENKVDEIIELKSSEHEKLLNFQSEYLYLKAEYDNFRKRSIKERSDLIKFGAERLITNLLDVIDNFDRALESEVSADNLDSFTSGMELVSKEFNEVLGTQGVEKIEAKGQPFDPTLHEAISSIETSDVEPGYVHSVFKPAYKLHGKVIRPAQVIVAQAPKESNSEDSNSEKKVAEKPSSSI